MTGRVCDVQQLAGHAGVAATACDIKGSRDAKGQFVERVRDVSPNDDLHC